MPSFPRPTCKPGILSRPIDLLPRLLIRFRLMRGAQMRAATRRGDRSLAMPVALGVMCGSLTLNLVTTCAEAQTLSFQPTWRQLSPATSPSPRRGATMAYDSAQGQVVLFGGIGSSSGFQNDTWTWNGAT